MNGRLPRRSADVVARRVAGEMLLVPVRGDMADLKGVFALNPVGAFIWDRLDGAVDEQALVRAICEAFVVSGETALLDARALLAALRDRGLVEASA